MLGESQREVVTEAAEGSLRFLRRETILLDPGQYEIDVTIEYLLDDIDFALAQLQGVVLTIDEARRRQRLLLVPIEFRLGITKHLQGFVNVPFGWSNGEFVFAGQDQISDAGGIGDVGAGLTKLFYEENEHHPAILGTFAFSAPTGNSSFSTTLAAPGSALGEGVWSLSADLTFIRTYDPVVIFYGLGYRHRFEGTFDGGVEVNPGSQAFYRFGVGFAINPRVTLSAILLGSYIGDNKVNGVRIAGSQQEPLQIRLAATIAKEKKKCKTRRPMKTVEPFVAFGISEVAIDSIIGVTWTR